MKQFSEKIRQAFGDWEIFKLLGAGQYGEVYEIHREDFGKVYKAALKIISIPKSADEVDEIRSTGMQDAEISNYFRGIAEDFVREFDLMAKLKGHTNIVSYEDHKVIPSEDGMGWTILIRMELLTPLTRYVTEKQMTKRDVIKLGIDLCKALELCQRVNVIHRDIKPANIFVSAMGEYKLGDFGVARIIENTMSGRTGTDTYMAPEVYYEDSYGPSADIYSLGIVMYRLLNGNRAPFLPTYPNPVTYRDNAEAFRRRINGEDLPQPAQADGRLAEIVLKASAYRSADRYSSPIAMRKDLEAILYDEDEAEAIYPEGDKVSATEGLSTNGTVSLKDFKKKAKPETEENALSMFSEEWTGYMAEAAEDDRRACKEPEDTVGTESESDEHGSKTKCESVKYDTVAKYEQKEHHVETENRTEHNRDEQAEIKNGKGSKKSREYRGDYHEDETIALGQKSRNQRGDYHGDETIMLRQKNRSASETQEEFPQKEENIPEPETLEKKEDKPEPEPLEKEEDKPKPEILEKKEDKPEPGTLEKEEDKPKSGTSKETEGQVEQGVTEKNKEQSEPGEYFGKDSEEEPMTDDSQTEKQEENISGNKTEEEQTDKEIPEQTDKVIPAPVKKKKWPILLPLAAAAGIGIGFFVYQSSTVAVMPNVCGMELSRAESMIQEAGFTAEVKQAYSDTIEKNIVFGQDVEEGEKQKKGSVITVTVSIGEEPVQVPDVAAKKKKEAVGELEALGFVVTVQEEYSNEKAGTVVSQTPEKGTKAEKGQEVILKVSKTRPDVKGMGLSEAFAVLEKEGFEVTEIIGKSNSKHPLNTILNADYQIGEKKGAILTFNCIKVPDVTGMEESEAIAALTGAGFAENHISTENQYNSEVDAGRVFDSRIQEEDWAAFGVAETIKTSLKEGVVLPGSKASLSISKGAKPKESTFSGNSGSYSQPAYTPPPQPAPQPSQPQKDEGVVFSDSDGKILN